METNTTKSKSKNGIKASSTRISAPSKQTAKSLLKEANNKNIGKRIKLKELIEFSLTLVTDEHIKMLREKSLTFEQRKEVLRQKYISIFGQISKDDFTGFMMTDEFSKFRKEYILEVGLCS